MSETVIVVESITPQVSLTLSNDQGPQGATGSTGSVGPTGSTPTISVGTVTTGAAGSSAIVTNSGTSTAATFNFSIPKGDPGTVGSATPLALGTAAVGTAAAASHEDHVHPTTNIALLNAANSFTSNQTIGTGVGTGAAGLEIGTGRTADGNAYIDLTGDTTYTDYGFRIIRSGGANGVTNLTHRGTGSLSLSGTEASSLIFATSNTTRMTIDATGNVGIGATASYIKLLVSGSVSATSGSSYGHQLSPLFPSTATTVIRNFYSAPSTEAATYTAATLRHFEAGNVIIGAGSTLTEQIGFRVAGITGATNNYGFQSNVVSAASAYNFYAGGTAANYFAGRVGIGGTNIAGGSMAYIVNTTAGDVGIMLRGAVSQTGNLQEWQNSAGTVLAKVDASGNGQFAGIDGGSA